MTRWRQVQAVIGRELLTVARSRAYYLLLAGVTLVMVGFALAGSADMGYIPTSADLLLPLELIIPIVSLALGYRTIVGDNRRGELAILQTYPIPAWKYVIGVYVGRAIAVLSVLAVPFLLLGVYVSTSTPELSTVATHGGVDSPVLFFRFALLSILFALSVLAIGLAISGVARSGRTALVLAVVALGAVVVGADLLLIRGVGSGWLPEGKLATVLALSPTSAFRGLVMETVLATPLETDQQYASPLGSFLGLVGWTTVSLLVTIRAVSET